jgi:hypothetical protein
LPPLEGGETFHAQVSTPVVRTYTETISAGGAKNPALSRKIKRYMAMESAEADMRHADL